MKKKTYIIPSTDIHCAQMHSSLLLPGSAFNDKGDTPDYVKSERFEDIWDEE